MSTHVSRAVCEGLAAAISGHQWTAAIPSVEAVFRRMPDYTVEDLGTLKVSIVPGPVVVNQDDQQPRGADFFNVTVAIVLAKHVASEVEIAALEDLNLAIVDAIRSHKITLEELSYTDWADITISTPYDPESLSERNMFLSQTDVTFLVPRDKLP